ncbi:MAG: hypothetical protein AAGD06_25790 [Acidobacteriota bacterium]
MPTKATHLRQLSEIREANRFLLDSIDNVTNTALGFKNRDGDPAILVFVARKIAEPWLPPTQVVPRRLESPSGLFCPTDVISIETDRDVWQRTFRDSEGTDEIRPLARVPSLIDTDPIEGVNLRLRDRVRGAGPTLGPGSQLGYRTSDGFEDSGTLACFASLGTGAGQLTGFLTNQHVGDFVGNVLYHPDFGARPVGRVHKTETSLDLTDVYGAPLGAGSVATRLTVDAGFCTLAPGLRPALLDPRLPVINAAGDGIDLVELGPELPLDPSTMGPIGEKVLGLGARRGEQRGEVVAVGFDFMDGATRSMSDYLIVGDPSTEFSDPGDSGKLVVTAEQHRPLAIMWGGLWARFSADEGLENFTNATAIDRVLGLLGVSLVRRL